MSFAEWLTQVLTDGTSTQAQLPMLSASDRANAIPVLKAAFHTHALNVGGPTIAFDPDAASMAAAMLALGCWQVAFGESDNLTSLPDGPTTPSAHLSADVCLRLLPAVYRRAKPRGADDPFVRWLEELFRRWPLSGVLAGLEGEPTTSLLFDGHPGLQLLYAERFAAHPTLGWLPPAGAALEQVERLFHRLGKPLPVPLSAEGK